MIINILFIIALTFSVAPAATAFSVDGDNKQIGRNLMFSLILALGQGVMYTLGALLGGTFFHLMEKYSGVVVFALCLAIAFRMILDTLKIKKGANLYAIDSQKHVLLLSIALSINTFIAGLMADFFPLFGRWTPYILIGAGFVWAALAAFIPFSRIKLTVNSLLNLLFAVVILVIGVVAMV